MDFEVYCDESGLEALSQKKAHLYTAIGGIWMLADYRSIFKEKMNSIKQKYKVYGELKWNKVSPKFFELYKDALEDPDSICKQGWDGKNKTYNNSRRVTLVKGNYIVIIIIYAEKKARFLTAYEVNNDKNLQKILDSPDWA